MVVWKSASHTEKQGHGAWPPPFSLPELARAQAKLWHWVSGCRARYLQTRELVLQNRVFPQQPERAVTHPSRVAVQRGDHRGVPVSITGVTGSARFPQLTLGSRTAGDVWVPGTALGVHGVGTPSPPALHPQ